jgi:endonuclease-3
MATSKDYSTIANILNKTFPDTKTFLNHHDNKDYEFLFAVILSAQATDDSVNKATAVLFSKYPSLDDFVEENKVGILECVRHVGLSNSKVNYILKTAKILREDYQGQVPKDRQALMKLPGVGYKTSGVVLGELYNYPVIPVDTHVFRVTHRLGLVPNSFDPSKTEDRLEKEFGSLADIHLHQRLILLGRNICSSRNPKCESCPLNSFCKYHSKEHKDA